MECHLGNVSTWEVTERYDLDRTVEGSKDVGRVIDLLHAELSKLTTV